MKLFNFCMLVVAFLICFFIGVTVENSILKREAINKGVGKYIISDTNSGQTEFIFISPTTFQTKTN